MSVAVWIGAMRLKTLPAAVVPVVVGTAVARASGGIAWGPALAALAGARASPIASARRER
jgi:1,4-dihydroxy-2-naphthoate octaprenyltransferase